MKYFLIIASIVINSFLVQDPSLKLIILDEPLSGLDPIGRKELKDIIIEVKKLGKTIFFSSHIVSDVEEVCDQVIFIKEGRLVYEGSVSEILEKSNDSSCEIIYSGKEGVESVCVPLKQKQSKILEMVKSDIEILSVNNKKLTLEEIFYKV